MRRLARQRPGAPARSSRSNTAARSTLCSVDFQPSGRGASSQPCSPPVKPPGPRVSRVFATVQPASAAAPSTKRRSPVASVSVDSASAAHATLPVALPTW
jgi:hypothetical protein